MVWEVRSLGLLCFTHCRVLLDQDRVLLLPLFDKGFAGVQRHILPLVAHAYLCWTFSPYDLFPYLNHHVSLSVDCNSSLE